MTPDRVWLVSPHSDPVRPSCLTSCPVHRQLGPNVSVGRNAEVGEGVRLREAIVLGGARVREHSLVLHSVLGWDSVVGAWSRIEGTPCDPDPNKPFAKMDNISLFNGDGKLNPSITILGGWYRTLSSGTGGLAAVAGWPQTWERVTSPYVCTCRGSRTCL